MPSQSPLRLGRHPDLELIETFRYEPERGFIRLERHLARMAASAEVFGFPFSAAHVREKLQVLADRHEMLRIRLALDARGGIKVTHQPYTALSPDTVWRLRIAKTRLDSNDPLLPHKTSRRDIYEQARAEFSSQEADEVLLLNESGDLCEGTITSLFVRTREGKLLTPSLECGLLAGVLREEMLENSNVFPVRMTLPDLLNAASMYVGNSLRGLIRAGLVQ